MKTKLKMLAAAALVTIGSAANASPFYLNNGADYGGVGIKANGPNTTGLFTDITYTYNSHTTFTDANGDGIYNVGDTVLGTGGLLKASGLPALKNDYSQNAITGFLPSVAGFQNAGGPAGNGFISSWQMSLGWDNLVGTVNAGGGVDYTSGTINLYYYDALRPAGVTALQFNVTGGSNNGIGQSLDLVGNLTVLENDLFFFADGQSFEDVAALTMISGSSNQNTSPFWVNGGLMNEPVDVNNFYAVAGGTGTIEGDHDGSVSFNVPEPGSLALLGLGLVGLAAARRRKSV